ncbi:phosphatidylethanolamine-binding protein [Pestalotiopsis sp. NC0098]|nr:phosphatidylethanolamine-binding protein [Pestalotiopsis sp. NC0098]
MPNITQVEKALEATKANPELMELTVAFGDKKITRGEYIGRAGAQTTPSFAWPKAAPGTTYLMLALDLDAPFPSLPVLGPILHGIQPGLTAGASGDLTTSTPPVAGYIGPAPPPLSGPHRYVFLLYEQPSGFDAKKFMPQAEGQEFPMMQRIRFDPSKFVKEAGLGEVLASNYFESN